MTRFAMTTAALAASCGLALATDYTVPSAATPTLEFALNTAVTPVQDGDTIILTDAGFYLSTYVVEIPNLTIRGADGQSITVDGLGLGTVFNVTAAGSGVTFENLTITGGDSGNDGGGINAVDADVTVIACTFTSNSADDDGAAMYVSGATGVVSGCTFLDNELNLPNGSDNGGAIMGFQSSMTVTDSMFVSNTANNYGGAMYFNDCTVDVSGCTLDGNDGALGGGLGFVGASTGTVTDTAIINNTAGKGGGIACNNATPVFERCDLRGNLATDLGGGVWVTGETTAEVAMISCVLAGNTANNSGGGFHAETGPDALLLNCTIVDNTAVAGTGGGVWNTGVGAGTVVKNCIIRDNAPNQYPSTGSNVAFFCNVSGGELANNTNVIDAAPGFVDAPGGDYRLTDGSPSIDAGDTLLVGESRASLILTQFPADLDEHPRIVAGLDVPGIGIAVAAQTVDHGAYEFQPAAGPACLADADNNGLLNVDDIDTFVQAFLAGCP